MGILQGNALANFLSMGTVVVMHGQAGKRTDATAGLKRKRGVGTV